MQRHGAEIRSWSESIRAFRVRLPAHRVQEVAALDFVCYVELDRPTRSLHEESIPMIAGDLTRQDFAGNDNGGAGVGLVDSGIHTLHPAFNHIFAVGWDFSGDLLNDPFLDLCGHGSHVAGTMLGNGSVLSTMRGMAPDVGFSALARVYNAKIFDSFCNGPGLDITSVFDRMHSVHFDNNGFPSLPPHVINHSWSTDTPPLFWSGTEARPRAFDQETFDHRQLHVLSAGNDGPAPFSITLEASAKNVMSVGNVVPFPTGPGSSIAPGALSMGSSRGPCGDGRFKPNVCAPGTQILSVDSLTPSGYTTKSGTSMAAPHVTGLVAQLVDHYPALIKEPQAISALLMAGAVSSNEAVVSTPSTGAGDHLSTFGAGRVESYRSHWADADSATFTWIFDQPPGGWQELDFSVAAGAQRIVSVMTYIEPAANAGASKALLADLDSWIDMEPFAAGGPSGDFSSHQSQVDNTEIATILNPAAGNWRIKVVPTSAFLTFRPVGVCVMVDYGKTHPATTLNVTADKLCASPGETVAVTATIEAPTFVSSALYAWLLNGSYSLIDVTTEMPGAGTAHHLDNNSSGQGVQVGDVVHGLPRAATWHLKWNSEGPQIASFALQSENTDLVLGNLTITVDGSIPSPPQNLISTTHPVNVWSNKPIIQYKWDPAIDELTDIAGYSFTSGPGPTVPDTVIDLPGTADSTSEVAIESDGSWFFTIRAVDECDNWGPHATYGPIRVDLTRPSGPPAISSTTHVPGVADEGTTVQVQWNTATDNLSGLAGYHTVWSQSATDDLDGPINVGAGVTSDSRVLATSGTPWYFHLVAVDVAGNRGDKLHFGPLLIYGPAGTPFCFGDGSGTACPCGNPGGPDNGCANSAFSQGAQLRTTGVASLSQDDVVLRGTRLPDTIALFFQGTVRNLGGAGSVLGDGLLCAGGSIKRMGTKAISNGKVNFPQAGDPPLHTAGAVSVAGSIRTYQIWYREIAPACPGSSFNLSNGVEVIWQP